MTVFFRFENHSTGFIQRRLYYFFISNSLQESTKTTDTLAAFSTDHSPITFSLCHLKEFPRGKGLWKFNKSLIKNENYREQMKTLIKHVLYNLDQDNIVDPQFRWEYLKYETRKFSIHFSTHIAQNKKLKECTWNINKKLLKLDLILLITLNILKLMKILIRSTKKKQMVLELEVNAIGTSTEKNL